MGRWGETDHTGYIRGKQHLETLRIARYRENKVDLEHCLVAHYLEHNRGEEHQFKIEVKQKFEKQMQRQIAEALNIHRSKVDILMNGKSEWMQPATTRMVVSRQEEEDFLAEPVKFVYNCRIVEMLRSI